MSTQKTLKQIRLIYFIVAILLAFFAALTFVFISTNGRVYTLDTMAENNLKSLIIVLALAGIPASYMFHNRKVKHIDPELSADKKMQQYRMSYFIKIMTLEGISLLSLLSYLITGNLNQLMTFGLVYLFLILNYPKKNNIFEELNIDPSES
ncbi:hypothetical protein [Carboxylicivirga taeanensis]|uniref:hypothetical protein n=1 Tax=Carboxylicivirga taeanensis TaxID=1416875 RepID=UPI003F6E2A5A